MRFKMLPAILALALTAACASVDETEHCVNTRYGKVIDEKVTSGLTSTFLSELTCFPVTQQAFPAGDPGEDAQAEKVPTITADSVALTFEVALDWHYGDAGKAFVIKRSHERVLQEISNGLRSGIRDAGATISMASLFGPARATLDEKFKEAVQAQVGPYIIIDRVYVRSVDMPGGIKTAWAEAATARAGQQRAKDQFVADSLNIRRTLMAAEADARKTELANRAMAVSPAVLQLEAAKAMAQGLAGACGNATTCIIGGSVMDTWRSLGGGRP